LTQPDGTVLCILKAKCLSRSDFMEANIGHCPSFSWRSICMARTVLVKGYRWEICHGRAINLWHQPWLKDSTSMSHSSAVPAAALTRTVTR
jgi:hypothetical protein